MALAKDPALLILDEPTTGLDATVEAEVLDLVANLQAELNTAVLFISHNLGVISKMCDTRGRAVRRTARRGRSGRDRSPGPTPSVHGRASALHPARRRAEGSPGGSTRSRDSCRASAPTIPGCVFEDRCALADDRCRTEEPTLDERRLRAPARCFHQDTRPHASTRRGRGPRATRSAIGTRRRCSSSTTSARSSISTESTSTRSSA